MDANKLLSPWTHSPFQFKNRVFMAPMTLSRAHEHIPTELMATYYSQRASAGLIFTEGSQVSDQGVGYVFTPGIHNEQQIAGWRRVTDSVHAHGGLIFCQLWHVGRVSHPDFHAGQNPVAPSAIGFKGQAFTLQGPKDTVTPRAMTLAEIQSTVNDFRLAAVAAKKAGFDGVEIHGANGYLPAQFLEDGSNQRQDQYGGSLPNRARFLLEITDAAIGVWGPERVSVRLSPRNPFGGMSDSHPKETYLYVVEQLSARKLGILHLMESAQLPAGVEPLLPYVRALFSGLLLVNAGYNKGSAEAVLNAGQADAVSFATHFIGNPDLPERFAKNAPLTEPDRATYYGGEAKGYSDYPALSNAVKSSPKGYWLVQATVSDPVKFAKYTGVAGPIIASYGGRVLARGDVAEVVEGSVPRRPYFVEFPSYDVARSCFRSAGYQEAIGLRSGAATFDIVNAGSGTGCNMLKSI